MKKLLFSFVFILFSLNSYSQDPLATFKIFDSKIYSLKNKGVKDFSVDISSSKLTQQINTLATFGKIKDLHFRVYWTLSPERLDIEVMGLPEGFKEVKEELKFSVMSLIENVLPLPMERKYPGYKFSSLPGNKISAQDSTGVAEIPQITFQFDEQLKLLEIQGQKPVGKIVYTPTYTKESYSEGRLVLKKLLTVTEENGLQISTQKTLTYGPHEGMTILKSVTINTEQKVLSKTDAKPVSVSETIDFKNYKINRGEAMRHFIKDQVTP